MYNMYRIKDGETLEDIAYRIGTTLDNLCAINNMRLEDLYRASEIVIPDTSKKYFEYYTVKSGDSIYEIARKYNINPDLLSSLNGLNNTDYIYPNQTIMIPKANYSYYITKEGDTLDSVSNMLNVARDKFLDDNKIIYLLEGQLLVKEK